ncbi:MAG: Dabb family protein [Chloroflexota bacterium]|nr:Dabb family protein [Chloroflexota bacterium]
MVVHVVLMRLRAGVSAVELDRLAERVLNLAESIAGKDSCMIGPNVTEEPLSQEYEFGFVVRFETREALAAYHADPAHEGVSHAIQDLTQTVLVFDVDS